jgi:hypothetical protein
MDVSPTERDETLRERIRIMDSEQFEQLVFELAHSEFAEVRRLSPPDGGADTIRPATSQSQAEVWQAKHYPAGINWEECEKSLASSINRWSPSRVTFVLPRDLSEKTERTFQTKLVDHVDAVGHEVAIDLWNLSELIRRLNANPDLRKRFFPESESAVEQIMRGVTAGGQLKTGGDLVERVRTLSEFAEQRDRDFAYTVMASAAGAPAPEWPEPPYLQFRLRDGQSEVQLMAWPRESAQISAPSFGFTSDSAGESARTAAIRAWGRGEQAAISDGAQLRFHSPELINSALLGVTRRGGLG